MSEANDYLHSIPLVGSIEEAKDYDDNNVLLFYDDVKFYFREEDSLIQTYGLGEKWDYKIRDLIRVIKIIDPLNIKYEKTNILTPLIYTDICEDIPYHLNTQGILFSKVTKSTIDWIKKEDSKNRYGLHSFDKFWLPFSKDLQKIREGDVICIFNRRVAGWDGSQDRPVIELLGAGGHLPTVWDNETKSFRELEIIENFQKEFNEELGGKVSRKNIVIFGGYENKVTHELVVLCGVEIDESSLRSLQEYAIQNIDEDTKGIYLGTFNETINFYRKNPAPFAGGAKAAPTNFPNNRKLMERVSKYLEYGNFKTFE